MASSSDHPWTWGTGSFNSEYLEKVGKSGSTKKLVWGFILFPFLCILLLRLYVVSPHHYWTVLELPRLPASLSQWNGGEGSQGEAHHMGSPLTRLVRGAARQQLARTGIACVYDPNSNFCVTTAAVAISTGPHRSPTVYLTGGQQLPAAEGPNGTTAVLQIQPYPRKTDLEAMESTAPVSIVDGAGQATLRCDVVHSVPAVVFSTGGYAGNFFHDVSELLIPLFLTAGGMRSRVRLVVTDYRPFWVSKYRRVMGYLTGDPTGLVPASPYHAAPGAVTDEAVHCFPAAVVGLKYHNNLACNASLPPGGATTTDFKAFLRGAFGLKNARVPVVANGGTTTGEQPPLLVLLSRRKSRALLNEDQVVAAAKEAGFRVEVALPKRVADLETSAELVNSCSVLVGVHGAGMTNMVFLPDGAVVLQIVPLGLDWAARTYYGREPAARLGLRYVEYMSPPEESTLYQKYPKDHPVIADPESIRRQRFYISKSFYLDGQNITVDVSRLKGTLLQAMELLHHPLQ